VALLPAASLAVQLTEVVPFAKAVPLGGVQTTVTVASQLSAAVGAKVTTAVQTPESVPTLNPVGQPLITGASSSVTTTSKVHAVALLLAASLAVQLTEVVPFAKAVPLGGVQTTVTVASQLSVAVGAYVTTAVQTPASVPTLKPVGQPLITGGWSSLTVTVKVHVPLFTEEAHVTVVVPFGNDEPEGGVHVTVPQVPLAVVEKLTFLLHWPGSDVVTMLAGQVRVQTA
jgi:molybdenum cofactor biosynthesis enzyme